MSSSVRLTMFLCFTFVILVLSPSIPYVHATTSYVPAVVPGNLAQYTVLYDTCQSTDPMVCQSMGNGLNDTQYAALQVVEVSGPTVTLQMITVYKNGTGSHQGVSVDVDTGQSNITAMGQGPPGDYFVLAGNLIVTDHIWNSPTAPIFNSTSSEMVLVGKYVKAGRSATAETLIETVAVFESSWPSFALKVNESAPL